MSNKPKSSITLVASSRTGGAERVRRKLEGMFHIPAVTGAKWRRCGPISKLGEARSLTIRRAFVAVRGWPLKLRIMVTAVEYLIANQCGPCLTRKKPVPRGRLFGTLFVCFVLFFTLANCILQIACQIVRITLGLVELAFSLQLLVARDLASGVLNCAPWLCPRLP